MAKVIPLGIWQEAARLRREQSCSCRNCGAPGSVLPGGEQWLTCDQCETFWPNPDIPPHDFGFDAA